jgi:hypothetical protein
MRNLLIALAAISCSSVASVAQTAPVAAPIQGFGASQRFEANITVYLGSVDWGSSRLDGISAEAQVFLPRIFFLKVATHEYDYVESNSLGFGFAIGAGNGRINLGVDLASVDEEFQTKLCAGYEHRFASGLFIGGSVLGFINDNSLPEGYACAVLNGGWKFSNGLSLMLSLSSADHILGLNKEDASVSLGIRHTY